MAKKQKKGKVVSGAEVNSGHISELDSSRSNGSRSSSTTSQSSEQVRSFRSRSPNVNVRPVKPDSLSPLNPTVDQVGLKETSKGDRADYRQSSFKRIPIFSDYYEIYLNRLRLI